MQLINFLRYEKVNWAIRQAIFLLDALIPEDTSKYYNMQTDVEDTNDNATKAIYAAWDASVTLFGQLISSSIIFSFMSIISD